MTFINDQAIYLPKFCVADNLLHPRGRKMYHSVSCPDEDIITMAFEAASACSSDLLEGVDAVLFATNTPVFKARYHASYLADLLEINDGILSLDFTGTNRAGTDALLVADTLIQSGKYKRILLVASEQSFPPIGSETKIPFAHGAAAMILSKEVSNAALVSVQSFSCDLAETFEYKGNEISYDTRFAINNAFKKNLKKALEQLDPGTTDQLMINAAYARAAKGPLAKAGFSKEQLADDPLIPLAGYLGAVHGLARLIAAMTEESGTKVLMDYNNGSNLVVVTNDKKINMAVDKTVEGKVQLKSYQDYLQLRKVGKWNSPSYHSTEMFSSEMIDQREKEQLRYLYGFKCQRCAKISYLKAARCDKCGATETEKIKLNRTGTVYTLTSEHYFPSAFPPVNMIVVDLEGGARVTVQQTDDIYNEESSVLKIGDKVKLVLRKMIETGHKPDYYWKCVKSDV